MDVRHGEVTEPTLHDAWIAPDGKFYNVDECGHSRFARERLGDEISYAVTALEDSGWLHFSGGWLFGSTAQDAERITSAQMDALMKIAKQARENANYRARAFMEAFTSIMNNGGVAYR